MVRGVAASVGVALLGMASFHAAGVQQPPAAPAVQPPAQSPAPRVAPAVQPAASHDVAPKALIDRYCVRCHNQKARTAELALDLLDVNDVRRDAVIWEKVVRKLRARQMPPVGMPRPDHPTLEGLRAWLERELDGAAEARPNPGRSSVRRLNRAEYANAVRDLLALEIDGTSLLPADDAADFDNIAEVLSVSPLLVERYLTVARTVSRLAVGNPAIPADIQTYELPAYLVQNDRMNEDLPFGTRGGIAVRHHFPLDAEYVIKVRLQRTPDLGYVRGIAEPQQLDVRLNGERVKLFTFGGAHVGKAEAQRGADALPPSAEEANYERNADEHLEVRFKAPAGTHLVQVAFVKQHWVPEDPFRAQPDAVLRTFLGANYERAWADAAVSSVSISGPFNPQGVGETASRRRIFACRPSDGADERACAKTILSALARRAYRRPVTDADVLPLMKLYEDGRGRGFESGIEMALRGILVSTEFLFRVERDPSDAQPGRPYRVSDIDLASRLSFFLWSSIPDDELLEHAERGTLSQPDMLRQQVRRMLADSRSKALVDNFAGQWLYLRNLDRINPSRDVFPGFDDNLREAFRRETELFFESTLREDRPVLDLLGADYTFVNERLAKHYGIPNVFGPRFRRVTVTDEARRGLLGHGSILTVTSYPNRTSPVIRGKWILENFIGTPPAPPPPDIPALKEKNEGGQALTLRQQTEMHRKNPACASCHRLMDPIGFALENFNAVGQWRAEEDAGPIDTSGVLPDGTKIEGPADLRKALLGNPEQFVHTVAEKLLTYALGRGLEYHDAPTVRGIVRGAAETGYRWSSIIEGIVTSTPFRMRRSRES